MNISATKWLEWAGSPVGRVTNPRGLRRGKRGARARTCTLAAAPSDGGGVEGIAAALGGTTSSSSSSGPPKVSTRSRARSLDPPAGGATAEAEGAEECERNV